MLAVDVPTRWRRVGFTAETIFAPASTDNEIELELELNIFLLHHEQTGGWVSSHFDIVDQFGPAERPMGGYLSLPASFTHEEATAWVERAREHVATLPPKVKKPKK